MGIRSRRRIRRPRHLGISPEEQNRQLLPLIRLILTFTEIEKEILRACLVTRWDIAKAALISGKSQNRVHNVIRKTVRTMSSIQEGSSRQIPKLDTREAIRSLRRNVEARTSQDLLNGYMRAPIGIKMRVLDLLASFINSDLRKSVTK